MQHVMAAWMLVVLAFCAGAAATTSSTSSRSLRTTYDVEHRMDQKMDSRPRKGEADFLQEKKQHTAPSQSYIFRGLGSLNQRGRPKTPFEAALVGQSGRGIGGTNSTRTGGMKGMGVGMGNKGLPKTRKRGATRNFPPLLLRVIICALTTRNKISFSFLQPRQHLPVCLPRHRLSRAHPPRPHPARPSQRGPPSFVLQTTISRSWHLKRRESQRQLNTTSW